MKAPSRKLAAALGAAAVALGGGLVACNLIVGAGTYSVGVYVDGSTEGDGGSGEASSCQEPPAGQACGAAFPQGCSAFDDLVQGCVMAESCGPPDQNWFFDVPLWQCMTFNYIGSRPTYSCLTTAKTCTDYFACEHTRAATLQECPNGAPDAGSYGKCNGSLAITCNGQGKGYVEDCSQNAFGGTCTTLGGLLSLCQVVPSCNGDGGQQCSGNTLFFCFQGKGYGWNCRPEEVCGTNNGDTNCFFAQTTTCSAPGKTTCGANNQVQACADDSQLFVEDCTAMGATCATDDAGIGRCVSPGCTPGAAATCSESCASDGHTINTCVGGAPYTVDCTQYGFNRCAQSKDTGGTLYTYCAN